MSTRAGGIIALPRSAGIRRPGILVPSAWEVSGLGGLVICYVLTDFIVGEQGYDIVNPLGSACFASLLISGALRMLRIDPVAMWVGVFWLRVATAIYFGLGFTVRIFFNEHTNAMLNNFFWVRSEEVFKANLICAFGMLIFMLTTYSIGLFVYFKIPKQHKASSDKLLLTCALVFCVIGYVIKYFIMLPYIFGMLGNVTYSSTLLSFSYLSVAGLFMLTLWCTRYGTTYFAAPVILVGLDMVTGTLQLAKSEVIFPVIIFILALLQQRVTYMRLAWAVIAVVGLFQILVPAVQFGRAELVVRYGDISRGSLPERLEILSTYFQGNSSAVSAVQDQAALSRISYAGETAAAIVQHDSGQPGTSLQDVFTIFIPRSLWPDKPVYDVGSRFNMSVSGDPNSSSWMGLYVESYWNLGWPGLFVVMVPLAFGYYIVGTMAITILKQSMWLHFPVVLLGLWMGMRVDSDIIQAQVTSIVLCLILYALANIAAPLARWLLASRSERIAPVATDP